MKEPIVDHELEALNAVVCAIKPLSPESRQKVIDTAQAWCGQPELPKRGRPTGSKNRKSQAELPLGSEVSA
jgi:hypothetical protein